VISGAISSIVSVHLFRRSSRVISSIGVVALLGATLLAASCIMKPSSAATVMTVLGTVLMSVGLLKESSIVNIGKKTWLRGSALTGSLLVGAAMLLGTSASPLLVVLGLTVVGFFLAYNLSLEQARQIAAAEAVLLYVLASFAAALCTLR